MALLMLALLLLSSAVLFAVRRDKETSLIFSLNISLAFFWTIMLIYIAKKGGIATQMQTLLFGTRSVRVWMQYLMFTLGRLGYLLAVGRYTFPLILVWLAMFYCKRISRKASRWLIPSAAVLPAVSLVIYYPTVFERVIGLDRHMIGFLVTGSLIWIALYLLIAIALMIVECRDITMAFYRRQFIGKSVMVLSLMLLYALYAPQDPAQVYLFYRNEYMGAVQGLWYLSPALSLRNYILAFALVVVCTAIGIIYQVRYVHDTIREGQDEVAIKRKFDAASKGASVFVHSVKNQLLANRVLLKRMGAILNAEEPDLQQLRDYHSQLEQNNAYMIGRMEELYKGIRTNSIVLVPERLAPVCSIAEDRLKKKYPSACVDQLIPEDVMILCDRNHFAEILYNIMMNGWEAQQAAGREEPLALSVHQERMWTVVEIRDHGNGIPKAQLRHIYEPFWSSKNTNMNWGMGLYYVRQIVRSHLGVLRIDTKLGSGTTFLIQMPRYDGNTGKQARTEETVS